MKPAHRRRSRRICKTAAAIAHTLGGRTQSEVLTLTRAQVDLDAAALRLDAGTTKNDGGREAYMPPSFGAWWRRGSTATTS